MCQVEETKFVVDLGVPVKNIATCVSVDCTRIYDPNDVSIGNPLAYSGSNYKRY